MSVAVSCVCPRRGRWKREKQDARSGGRVRLFFPTVSALAPVSLHGPLRRPTPAGHGPPGPQGQGPGRGELCGGAGRERVNGAQCADLFAFSRALSTSLNPSLLFPLFFTARRRHRQRRPTSGAWIVEREHNSALFASKKRARLSHSLVLFHLHSRPTSSSPPSPSPPAACCTRLTSCPAWALTPSTTGPRPWPDPPSCTARTARAGRCSKFGRPPRRGGRPRRRQPWRPGRVRRAWPPCSSWAAWTPGPGAGRT